MSALADPDLARLVKLCGLLGSAQVGERAAAALKVSEWLQTRGLVWEDVLGQEETLPAVSVTVGNARPADVLLAEARTIAYSEGYNKGLAAGMGAGASHVEVQKAYARGFADGAQASRPGPQPATQAFNANAQSQMNAAQQARTWQDAVREIMALPGWPLMQVQRPKESDFVQSLLARNWANLTPKQELWLRDICLRLGVEQW